MRRKVRDLQCARHKADERKFGSSAPGSRVSSNRRKSSCLVPTPMDSQRQNLIWTCWCVCSLTGDPLEQAVTMLNRLNMLIPIDLLVRTPEQIQQRLEMGDSFMRDIISGAR